MTLLLLFNQPASGATSTAFRSFVEMAMVKGDWPLDDYLAFAVQTHDDTGAAAAADAVPSYVIRDAETGASVATGNMSAVAGVDGMYTARLQLTTAAGFATDTSYTLRVAAIMATIPAACVEVFRVGVPAANVTMQQGVAVAAADVSGYINVLNVLGNVDGTVGEVTNLSLTAQQAIRDAMKLAPSAGAPAAGSVDAKLDDILEDTGTTLPGLISDLPTASEIDTELSGTHGGGSWEGGGSGSYAGDGTGYYTDTIDDGTSPLDGVRVQLYTAQNRVGPAYEAYTNALGVFEMWPDPGTYYRWLDLAGFSGAQDVAVVVTEP